MAAMASLVLDGALERHPELRVAFLESGTGWLPYWLHRLDEHREWLADTECAGLSLSASEYFARQCVISSEADDDLAATVVGAVGADHVMWASDFPHPDAVFPDAARRFVANLEGHGVTAADVEAVLWSTPLDFYGLQDRVPVSSG
jgi:predicted TIM-barrel fold metal-dependent hydrolase